MTAAASTSSYSAFALEPFPEVHPGDDLAATIIGALTRTTTELRDGDILVVASKIVSIAEQRHACRSTRPAAFSSEVTP